MGGRNEKESGGEDRMKEKRGKRAREREGGGGGKAGHDDDVANTLFGCVCVCVCVCVCACVVIAIAFKKEQSTTAKVERETREGGTDSLYNSLSSLLL